MYTAPTSYKTLLKNLRQQLIEEKVNRQVAFASARLILNVELAFELLNMLPRPLQGEPIAVVWVLLSGTPLRHASLQILTVKQQRAIANARILLSGFTGRFGWEGALRDYALTLPAAAVALCQYKIDPDNLHQQIVAHSRSDYHDTTRTTVLRDCLTMRLPFKEPDRYMVEGNQVYQFEHNAYDTPLRVQFSREQAAMGKRRDNWFEEARPRTAISVTFEQLMAVAEWVDQRLEKPYLARNLRHIRLLHSAENPATDITIEGLQHYAGMVSAGKSTLMKLWSAWVIYQVRELGSADLPQRITLVVGDTASAIQLAHDINCWFALDPETDAPVAMPLLGRTTRHKHIAQLIAGRDYHAATATLGYHWGERFLNPICPLHALIPPRFVRDKPLLPGSEPCSSLYPVTKDKLDKEQIGSKRHECPLFTACPSQQLYRDMVTAQVWITTHGGMAQGSLPVQIEPRIVKIGDIVYEQSDLVIFDEVDTVLEWFDRTYAKQETLLANGNGILDKLDKRLIDLWQSGRVQADSVTNWIETERRFHTPATRIINLLQKYNHLRRSLERGYFTARGLLYRCARRMVGLHEFNKRDDTARATAELACLMDVFESVMYESDPLDRIVRETSDVTLDKLLELAAYQSERDPAKRKAKGDAYKDAVELAASQLLPIMQHTMNNPGTYNNRVLYREWIVQLVPDIKERLVTLHKQLRESDDWRDRDYVKQGLADDSTVYLARRLDLAINVVLLDRHTRHVFYRWGNRPNRLQEIDQPFMAVPSGLADILPLPPIGRTFGIYHLPADSTDLSHLSTFGYTNVGRDYVLNFHRLREQLEGRIGPNVLVMSGTSYLPHSTRWHVGTPDGVIKRVDEHGNAAIEAALLDENCWFDFRPMQTPKGKPIRISGIQDKRKAVRALTNALLDSGTLVAELNDLHALNDTPNDFWRDRQRLLLLVNSYDQCEWVGELLRERWPEQRDGIHYLVRGTDSADPQINRGQYKRIDIEQFAHNNGVLLVAPLQAVGRGFNILNTTTRKAAFGAIFFLTRPMPYPHDAAAIAQEVNRRLYDWYDNPDFTAWQLGDSVYATGIELRNIAKAYWRDVENRKFYTHLHDEEDGNLEDAWRNANPRRDLAATTAGRVIQAIGRLLRGDVPFHAYFVDAAWSPNQANKLITGSGEHDTGSSSLLVEMIDTLHDYVQESDIGRELYGLIQQKLDNTRHLWD